MKSKFLISKYVFAALMLTAALFISCEDDDEDETTIPVEPVSAEFSFSTMFLEISTTNLSENAVSFEWDFGDGVGMSTDSEPTYLYSEAGTFTLTLVATGEDGSTDTSSTLVTVAEEMITPMASFTSEADFLMVNFNSDASENAVSYEWDFGVDGDDTDVSTEPNPSFTYPVDGTYTVSLTVTSSTGNVDNVSEEVTVAAAVSPTADFTFEANGLEVAFTDASVANDGTITAYSWDFGVDGDDTDVSTEQNPAAFTYPAAGDYIVTLDITFDELNGETTATTTQTITVTEAELTAPVADFTFEATDLMVSFTDASVANDGNITSFAWDFGDGVGMSTDQNPMYTYAAAGDFEVSLTITFDEVNGETTSSTTQTVSVTAATMTMDGGPGTPGNQFAFITDTDPGDTGELRLDLDNTIAMGRMTVVVSKEMTQDGFINLSGTSTSRSNAMIDMRINDSNGYEFTESGASVNAMANFPAFVNDEFVTVDITWDATVAGAPLITVTIDGQPVTAAPFPSEGGADAIADGVRTVQFRLGGGSGTDETGAGLFVDNLRVYDTSTGMPNLVFEDDYESYNVGDSLDPDVMPTAMDTPYRNNSSEAVVDVE